MQVAGNQQVGPGERGRRVERLPPPPLEVLARPPLVAVDVGHNRSCHVNGHRQQSHTDAYAGNLPECDNRTSRVVNGSFTYDGVIQNITLVFEGVFFEDHYNVQTVADSYTYDIPLN